MEPWYKIVQPRKEVREGRSFNPDEFAIALEQVVAGTAPEDYRDADKFFSRTCFTRALTDHTAMVLRRLSGRTENTAPVLALITQFGGGKTHTLATLYHLAEHGSQVVDRAEIRDLLRTAGLSELPQAKAAVFVGNAWDPQPGRETPWIDIARQLAGDEGVALLGPSALTTPPGTDALGRVFTAAGRPVIVLCDEVLNYLNRYQGMASAFHAFIQNLTVAMTGTSHGAAVISLPRSQVEMTDFDQEWQEKITRVVRRVAKDLIVLDEAEISEVIRRRLFEDLGPERTRKKIAREYADWCFERRAQLPAEWTAVDTATTEAKGREFLTAKFEACYPFHPSTISVFQRKWQALRQYQQTRGTLAMLAQWISWAFQEGYHTAWKEPLITLGSAPLHVLGFKSVVLGQLGENRLGGAIDTDISGQQSHAGALDADTSGLLVGIHRRVAAAILFESSGGMTDKMAHLPEIRFAVGEPGMDTTSVDTAAMALEQKGYFLRKAGSDGYKFGFKPKLKKVVNDRRASLDEEEVAKAQREAIRKEFERGAALPPAFFPEDSAAVQDSPKLTVVLMDPAYAWENGDVKSIVSSWTKERGGSDRLYPAALIWVIRKPGRELKDSVETLLAWKRVQHEQQTGTLSGDFDKEDLADIQSHLSTTEGDVKDEVWASYRYVAVADSKEPDGLKVIDLGAGHASSGETLCGRVITALKSQALLNESVGAGYIERNWPPALQVTGAWPLAGLRQSFLNGSLTRLMDPDTVLKRKIAEFVEAGDFGLGSGRIQGGGFTRTWFRQMVSSDEIAFDADVYLLTKAAANALLSPTTPAAELEKGKGETTPGEELVLTSPGSPTETQPEGQAQTSAAQGVRQRVLVRGSIPPEIWNRLGMKLIPRLRSACPDLGVRLEFVGGTDRDAAVLQAELRQSLVELGLTETVEIVVRPETTARGDE
ncbi:MAG: DUF499 domain-containing protein [Armatimonadota bacterium]|nr:DUF499 domain-containing protein [Armatimonadota bacterium]